MLSTALPNVHYSRPNLINYFNSRKTLFLQETMLPFVQEKNIKLSLALAARKFNLVFNGVHLQLGPPSPNNPSLPRVYSPFSASVGDDAPEGEVTPGGDSIFDGRRLSTGDQMAGRWRSIPAARGRAFND